MQCDQVRPRLSDYVADRVAGRGEHASLEAQAVEQHLQVCAACRAAAERLRIVEEALWRYPGVTPPADLTADIMRRVARERPAVEEQWQALPWDVWVPAVAFVLALLVAVASIPPHLLSVALAEGIDGTLASWTAQVRGWLAPLAQGGLLAVALAALLAVTAGWGLSLALSAWPSDELSAMEARVAHAAARLWNLARRAH
ncbi:MAG TPA: hypothetical protein GX714_06780 [Chloroflexi bacterium]|jgi:predicted anti-sigma-YlaC factor YlaD|nr:hypothetical protein [Chloroflexota bacterium]